MAGIVALIVKVMPESAEADLDQMQNSIKEGLEKEGAQNISFEVQPVAFGLKALMVKFAWPEEKNTEIVEETLRNIQGVSSVSIEDYRRAFG